MYSTQLNFNFWSLIDTIFKDAIIFLYLGAIMSSTQSPSSSTDRVRAQEEIVSALIDNKSILLQSDPGMGTQTLAKAAISAAKLHAAVFDNSDINPLYKDEEKILQAIANHKCNVILVNALEGDNLDAFIKVSEKTKLPLIVCQILKRSYTRELQIMIVEDAASLKLVLGEIKNQPDIKIQLEEHILDKMRILRSNSYITGPSKHTV